MCPSTTNIRSIITGSLGQSQNYIPYTCLQMKVYKSTVCHVYHSMPTGKSHLRSSAETYGNQGREGNHCVCSGQVVKSRHDLGVGQIISHPLLMTIHTDNERISSRMVRSDCHQTNSGVILFLDDHMEGYAWAGRF